MSTAIVEVQSAVAEFDRVAAGIALLQQEYAGVVFDVSTTKGLDAAKTARATIREPRYEIEKVRKVSRSGDKGPWKQWWSEMARKTVFRRLAKSLPNAADLAQVLDHDNENYDLDQPQEPKKPTAPLARLKQKIGVEVPKDPSPE